MISRRHGNLILRREPAPGAAAHLERDGYAHIPAVLDAQATAALRDEIAAIYDSSGPDRERDVRGEWRYAMFNRSPLAQQAVGAPAILDAIEPLLGEDCHIIANTAWRNPAGHQAGAGTWTPARTSPGRKVFRGRTRSPTRCSPSACTCS